MAQEIMNTPQDVVEKNIVLVGRIMQYLLDHPDVLGSLPDDFELVVLPEDDPEMRAYNLELLDRYGDEGNPVVFARTRTRPKKGQKTIRPVFFAPIVTIAS